ncbi:glycosyltransferase [Vibrio sinensis]|uniref:Glycosyltransferase n=1 Tax=Vibrio sinensis TaxID=2302434 RepID=A0A3A6QMB0_9VIBR|nr:glycosyltransferase [Vibrio sinensis]RJX72378.1 glycosyltransferase [Vibrio sinensis]
MNEITKPKLSVIIPTKNRYSTLTQVLDVMLDAFPYEVEFVVQDNTPDNGCFSSYLLAKNDKRIKYFHQKDSISIVDNTEMAISNACGDYMCFIGDDDLVLPEIMSVIEQIDDKNVDVVIYPGAYYWWKNVKFEREDHYNQPGALWIPTNRGEKNLYPAHTKLDSLLSNGCTSIGELPRLYHGLVRSSALKKIKKLTGNYVLGASPDMALAASLALTDANVMYQATPLTIYGASKNSGGGYTAENKHFGKIQDQEHIPEATKNNWSKYLPEIWSEHTVYPQTVIEVYERFKQPCPLNFTTFYASMYANEPHLRSITKPYIGSYLKNHKLEIIVFIQSLLIKSLGRIKRKALSRLKAKSFIVKHGVDIFQVNHEISRSKIGK